jgi:hypothetical protein
MLRDKGFKARALLGGFPAWSAAGGETEPINAKTDAVPQQNRNAQQGQHVVASPNPTVDDSKTKAGDAATKVEGTQVQPDQTTTQAPMANSKKSKSKHKPKKSDTP